jgi:hypothetical protein
MEGQIIFIDNFENVIVNITREEFEEQRRGRSFKIVFKRDEVIEKISDTYADVQEGEKLAIFNSATYLEIAINKGNAAGLFGLQGFSEKQNQGQHQYLNNRLFYQPLKYTLSKCLSPLSKKTIVIFKKIPESYNFNHNFKLRW